MKIVVLAPTRALARDELEKRGFGLQDRRFVIVTERRTEGLLGMPRGMTGVAYMNDPGGLPRDVVAAAAARDVHLIRFEDLPAAVASMGGNKP